MAAAVKWFMILAIVAMLGGGVFLVVKQQMDAKEIVGEDDSAPVVETRKASTAPQSERQKAFSDAEQMRKAAEEAKFQNDRKRRKVEEEIQRMESEGMEDSGDSGPGGEHLLGPE